MIVLRRCCCRLAALLTRFPLPRGSAEGEVIASSIAARCWLSERQVGMYRFLHMHVLLLARSHSTLRRECEHM